jgi:hypothetical protein
MSLTWIELTRRIVTDPTLLEQIKDHQLGSCLLSTLAYQACLSSNYKLLNSLKAHWMDLLPVVGFLSFPFNKEFLAWYIEWIYCAVKETSIDMYLQKLGKSVYSKDQKKFVVNTCLQFFSAEIVARCL